MQEAGVCLSLAYLFPTSGLESLDLSAGDPVSFDRVLMREALSQTKLYLDAA